MKRVLEIGGVVAGVVLIAFGVAAIVLGVNGKSTVGTVMPMPTIASAAGAFQRLYASQATAMRKMPSPTSETDMPVQSTRKSRCPSGERS